MEVNFYKFTIRLHFLFILSFIAYLQIIGKNKRAKRGLSFHLKHIKKKNELLLKKIVVFKKSFQQGKSKKLEFFFLNNIKYQKI